MHSEVGRTEDDRLNLSKNMVAEQPLQVAGEMSSSSAQQLPSEVVHAHAGSVKGQIVIPSSDGSVGSTSTTHTLSSAFTDWVVSSSNENADTCMSIQDGGGKSTRRRRRRPAHDDTSSVAKTSHDADTMHSLWAENSRLKEEMRTMRRALHRSSAVTAQDDQTELIMQLKLEIAELSTNLDEARMAALSEKEAGDSRLVDLRNLLAETQRQLVEAKTKSGSTDTIFVVVEKDDKDQKGQVAVASSAVEHSSAVDHVRIQALQEEMAGVKADAKKARKELDLARKENQRLQRVQEITRSLQTDKVDQTNDEMEELEKQLSEAKVQIAELKSELEGSENTSSTLMEETSQLAHHISALTTEKTDLFAKMKKYKQVVPSMKQSLTKLQKDKIELRVRLEAAEVLAEDFKKRYIRLGESLAGISMADLEDLLHKDDLDKIGEERERKEQEKKGKFRRMFEGSTIGMALTETIGPGSGENTGGIRRRRSLSDADAAFAFEADLCSEDPPALSPLSSHRPNRRARSFDFGEVNVQQLLNDTSSGGGVNVNERRPRRSRRSSNLSSGRRPGRSQSVDPSEMRLDIDIIGDDYDDGCATSDGKQPRQPRQVRRTSAIVASSRRRSSSADPYSTKRSSMPNSRSASKTGSLADSLANVLEGVYSANRTMSEANNSSGRTGIDSIAESSMNSLGEDWIEQCVVAAFQFEGCNSDSAALNVDLNDIVSDEKDAPAHQLTTMPSARGESDGARDVDDYISGK